MFKRVFVEHEVWDHPRTQAMLRKLKGAELFRIHDAESIFSRSKKPYLHKRTDRQAFIAKKRGTLIKEAPAAYCGQEGDHFYFIHQYNCIFECEYCYLQGYFNSPDHLFFINHEDITAQIHHLCSQRQSSDHSPLWFHAGEFSDSLALAGLTDELSVYWQCFAQESKARLELRTKSVNIRPLLHLGPLDNVFVTFSLSPEDAIQTYDRGTPPLAARLKAIQKLHLRGFKIGIHLDPIIYSDHLAKDYKELVEALFSHIPTEAIAYLSIGVVRFTKDVYREVKRNYPRSALHASPMVQDPDGKRRYAPLLRQSIFSTVTETLLQSGMERTKIYQCMEQ